LDLSSFDLPGVLALALLISKGEESSGKSFLPLSPIQIWLLMMPRRVLNSSGHPGKKIPARTSPLWRATARKSSNPAHRAVCEKNSCKIAAHSFCKTPDVISYLRLKPGICKRLMVPAASAPSKIPRAG
jgi:hypothetical protein